MAVLAAAVPATPAAARERGADCEGARFTATAQADLAKIAVLDAGLLRSGLPALADVRLASAHGSTDSARRPHRTIATARAADAKLLGLGFPIAGAESHAPTTGDRARTGLGAADPARTASTEVGSVTAASAEADSDRAASTDTGSAPAAFVKTAPVPAAPEQAGSYRAASVKTDFGGTTYTKAGRGDDAGVSVDAGGLATIRAGKSTARASWDDAYRCGSTGPLTRSATMLAEAQFLAGGNAVPAIRAMRAAGAGQPTSLLTLGSVGSTQSATDLVRVNTKLAVQAAAGVTLADLTLFGGTPQEVSAKVITQPTLTVVATGDRNSSEVRYRPAVLAVTAAGKPVANLDTQHLSVGVDLFGSMQPGARPSQLSARLSLGGPEQKITDDDVRAEVESLRVEVQLGGAHLLDVSLGHLYAQASAPPLLTVPGRKKLTSLPAPAQPAGANQPASKQPTSKQPGSKQPTSKQTTSKHPGSRQPAVRRPATQAPATEAAAVRTAAEPREKSSLALTGANVAAAATGGLLLVVLGSAVFFLTRRRKNN